MELSEFEQYLTPEELENFKRNCELANVGGKEKNRYERVVKICNPQNIISRAFIWIATEEGHKYWHKIAQRLEEMPICPEEAFTAPTTPDTTETTERYVAADFMHYFTNVEWSKLCAKASKVHPIQEYTHIMTTNVYLNIGDFIMTALKTDRWRGVPKAWASLKKRDEPGSGFKIEKGEFAVRIKKKRTSKEKLTAADLLTSTMESMYWTGPGTMMPLDRPGIGSVTYDPTSITIK